MSDYLEVGEVISSNIAMDPIEIVFPQGNNLATITLSKEGNSYHTDIQYSIRSSFAIAEVEAFIASLNELPR